MGNVMVMPDDLVIAKRKGELFIPDHLADQVISTAEFVTRKDKFGFEMVKSGRYTPGQIDSQWNDTLKNDFLKWLGTHPEMGSMTKADVDKMMSKRTW